MTPTERTNWKPTYPIHVDNTVDKWCSHCGRSMKKRLQKTVKYNSDTGQKKERYWIDYSCPIEWLPFANWNHESYIKPYEEVEAV